MGRRSIIPSKDRQEWFRRFEEGESAKKIAEDAQYDARTVKNQIDLERQKQERKAVRTMVLRTALEKHYKQICDFAGELEALLGAERNMLPMKRENPMWLSLRQHLPRYKMWKNFEKWERLRDEVHIAEQELKVELRKQLIWESGLEPESEPKDMDFLKDIGLTPRMIESLYNHIRSAAEGQAENLLEFNYPAISDDYESDAVKLARKTLEKAPQWPQFNKLGLIWKDLEQVKKELRDELEIVRLREVLPGRCRYCPI
jgi:hypothetical protein